MTCQRINGYTSDMSASSPLVSALVYGAGLLNLSSRERILILLGAHEECPRDILVLLGMTNESWLSKYLLSFRNEGLVRYGTEPTNSKRRYYYLTDKGEVAVAEILAAAQERLMRPELARFAKALEGLVPLLRGGLVGREREFDFTKIDGEYL